MTHGDTGRVVVLNGAPRSGKSSIARAIQETFEGAWMNLGVDAVRRMTPDRFQPGIGLRPGGERPDLEEFVRLSYASLYESVAAHVRLGLNVVVDVGHHDEYSRSLGTLVDAARRLDGIETWLVGVRCTIEVVMERRAASPESTYARGTADEPVPAPVAAWQRAVHIPGIYDLEVDTSLLSPAASAEEIRQRMRQAPVALRTLATQAREPGDGGD